MRNIVLTVMGCGLAFSLHAESWERLNDIEYDNDKQVFIDSESLQLTDINILGSNPKYDVFSVAIKIKNALPTDNLALTRSNNSYYIEKYYVNCDSESMALQAKEQYTENDERLMTYVNIQEYANKKDIYGSEFQHFAVGTKEYSMIQAT